MIVFITLTAYYVFFIFYMYWYFVFRFGDDYIKALVCRFKIFIPAIDESEFPMEWSGS